jgi:hypothetical protein
MKNFKLKSKGNAPDINFTMDDLIPVNQSKSYKFTELVRFIDYTNYFTVENWTSADFNRLYKKPGNAKHDFFKVRDTTVIVIPGQYLFPTLLTESQNL